MRFNFWTTYNKKRDTRDYYTISSYEDNYKNGSCSMYGLLELCFKELEDRYLIVERHERVYKFLIKDITEMFVDFDLWEIQVKNKNWFEIKRPTNYYIE